MDTARNGRRLTAALALIAGSGLAVAIGPTPAAGAAALPAIFVNPPRITPDPVGSGQLPAAFTVHPDLDPAARYLLTIDGVPQPFTVVNNQMTFTASPGCGAHTANVSLDNTGNVPRDQPRATGAGTNISFFVACVRLSPSSITYTSQPATITVTGDDWITTAPVDLTLDGHPIGQPTQTDEVGTFIANIQVSGLGCTPHTITADQPPPVETTYSEVTASAQLTVTGCPSTQPTPPPPARSNPRITANPPVLTEGALTHVTGTGFVPNQPLTLTWFAGSTAPAPPPAPATGATPCSPNADSAPPIAANAAGNIDVYCYARPHELVGAAQLVAVQGTGQASAPVVIEGGSMQPSTGDQLIFRR
ncbi:MAG: hypothetical protein ACRDVE_13080 [Actinocrinis sp.]